MIAMARDSQEDKQERRRNEFRGLVHLMVKRRNSNVHRGLFALYVTLVVFLACASVALAAENTVAPAAEVKSAGQPAAAPSESKVTIEAKDTKVKDVLDSLAKQSKEKFVIESTVKGTVASLSLKDVSLESALGAVCTSAKLQWRKIYIAPDSKLLEQPDRFASTVRLMSGLSFPDMVLAGSSMNKVGVHFEDKKAVTGAEESATKTLGMGKVYLITNDAAIAAKASADEKNKDKTSTAVDQMGELAKQQMDMFLKMTPEEREQALVSNLNMMDQVGPEYMASAMESLMKIDPEKLRRLMSRQTEMLFNMPQEQRRAMMKFNMEAMKTITPELQKMLQEDAIAIMEEMKATGNLPQKP